MKKTGIIIVILLLPFSPTLAQEPAGGESAGQEISPVSSALINKFLDCYAEEAEVTAEDRAVLKQFAGDLAEGLSASLSGGAKMAKIDINAKAGSKAEKILDPQAVAGYTCTELASKMEGAMSAGGLDKLLGDGPAEPWAIVYTNALSDKVLQCYSVEVKRAVTTAEKAQLTQFNGRMARMVSLMTSTGACTVDNKQQGKCTEGIMSILCVDLASALTSDPGQLVKALSVACSGFINCGIEEQIQKELR